MFRNFASKFTLPIFISFSAFSSCICAADYNPSYPPQQTNQQPNRYGQPQPSKNPNQSYAPPQANETSNQSNYFNHNGRQEIAAVSRSRIKDEDRPLYYQEHDRANWDYRENWHRNRNAYLNGVNQSQFDDHLAPHYGYGSYNYPYNYYSNYSGASQLGGATRPYTTNTYYPTNSYYNRYYGNYAAYPAANPTYYPQYGTSNYTVYPQYGYGSYSMSYPQSTYNTEKINSYYGDGYYRNYRNDYYRNVPGGYTTTGVGSSYYDTNRPATTYPYYNVQPRSDSYQSYEFPRKTDMPYMPSPY